MILIYHSCICNCNSHVIIIVIVTHDLAYSVVVITH